MPSQFAVPKQEGIHPCKASAVLSQHCNTIYSVQYRSEARYSRRHKVERALYGSSIPFHYRSIPVYYGVECNPRRSVHAQRNNHRATSRVTNNRRILNLPQHNSQMSEKFRLDFCAYCEMLREANKEKCLECALLYAHEADAGFLDVIYSDETSIQLETHRCFCCRKIGQPHKP